MNKRKWIMLILSVMIVALIVAFIFVGSGITRYLPFQFTGTAHFKEAFLLETAFFYLAGLAP